MKPAREPKLSPRMQRAIGELKALLLRHYPEATLRVEHDPEAYHSIDLLATVDVDDIWDVFDLVRDPLFHFLVEEHLPIYVIPLRTPEREAAMREQLRREWACPPPIPPDLMEPVKMPEGR